MNLGVAFAPLVPQYVVWTAFGVAVFLSLLLIVARSRGALVRTVAMALLVLALGQPMLVLFGPEFTAGYPLLFLLVLGVVARAAVGPCESLLTMSGNQNICAFVYALTLALNVALSMLLIPSLGLWGAATATALSMIFEAGALSFTVWRKLGIVMAVFIPAGVEKEFR